MGSERDPLERGVGGGEVSCRVTWLYTETARQKGASAERLLAGLPFTEAHLADPKGRISWDDLCVLNERLEAICGGPEQLEQAAEIFSQAPIIEGLRSMFGLLASASTIYWASHRWFGAAMFTVTRSTLERLGDGRLRFTITIPDEYRDSPQFFRVTAGTFRANPRILGQPNSRVELQLAPRRAVYLIEPPPSRTLWARLRRAVSMLFSGNAALKELGSQQDELRRRFEELKTANSRVLLQAGQLQTVELMARELTRYTDIGALAGATVRLLEERFHAVGATIAMAPAAGAAPEVIHAWGQRDGAPGRRISLVGAGETLGALEVWGGTAALEEGAKVLDDLGPWIAIALENARSFALLQQYQAGLEAKVAERTAQLNESLVKLIDNDRQKTEFFANASHELRTPLTLMLAPLEIVANAPGLAEEAKLEIGGVVRSGYRLLKLVNDLLDLSKIEAGKMTLQLGAADLAAVMEQVVRPWGTALKNRRITLDVQVPVTIPFVADVERLEQVGLNLLSNAVKFTPDEGRITVKAGRDAAGLFFSIENTGEGIEPEELGRLFGRFTQSTRSRSRRFGSTGLGLAVVRELVELHGGTISAESELGAWVRFTVRLPEGRSAEALGLPTPRLLSTEMRQYEATAVRENSVVVSPVALATVDDDPDRATLLVAEDNEALRAFVIKNLSSTFRIIEAGDGEQALRLARQHLPDVILSDLMMPGLDGLQLCSALKAEPATAHIPFVLLTARADIDSRLRGLEQGADDYLMKPFHLEELRARLRSQLRMRQLAVKFAQREKLAALGAVVAGVAHEIRNPLNGIINALEPLKELIPGASAEVVELLDLAIASSKRVEYVSDQLLRQGRAGEGSSGDVDLGQNVALALQLLAHKVGEGMELSSSLSPRESVKVIGEAGALHQVWINLIDNAIQAASPGGKGRVNVAVSRVNGHAIVEVSDNGPGIEPRHLKRIFDPFFTTKEVGSGTGLGLAIVRQIVEKHGGQITVDSRPGQGARFTVKLPTSSGVVHAVA